MDQGCRPPHGAKSKLLLFMQVSTSRWLLVESSVADLPGSILESTHWSLLGSAEGVFGIRSLRLVNAFVSSREEAPIQIKSVLACADALSRFASRLALPFALQKP